MKISIKEEYISEISTIRRQLKMQTEKGGESVAFCHGMKLEVVGDKKKLK